MLRQSGFSQEDKTFRLTVSHMEHLKMHFSSPRAQLIATLTFEINTYNLSSGPKFSQISPEMMNSEIVKDPGALIKSGLQNSLVTSPLNTL